ncbi:MAG: ATP-binding protein [Chloroherpetonaceae bacterium]|nr:ATP-binding protein [Chloroherpetonaceae bacterium]MCS7211154.1 ATP-binding protein [Chloroherpetonaceae bacterium]MDW8020150.1 ATP-binding protein [Chloroherpetonaceae bacterium]
MLLFASLVFVYAFVLPQYHRALLSERTSIISEAQRFAIEAADRDLSEWLRTTQYLVFLFESRPQQFELALKDQIGTHSELIRVLVRSLETGDELDAHSSAYAKENYVIAQTDWQPSKSDASILVAFHRVDSVRFVLALQKQATLAQKPYLLTAYFDATNLVRTLLSLPLSEEAKYALFLSKADVLMQLASTADFPSVADLRPALVAESRTLRIQGKPYLIAVAPFKTVPLYFAVVLPEAVVLAPAAQLMWFSLVFVAVVCAVMFIAGWLASAQVTKPVQQLVEAVRPMQALDFSHKIELFALPELHTLSQTIEAMRKTLDRYQKMNVEKIILEEWKTKLLMTYSEDLIGIAGSDDRFTFQNARFAELCQRLGFQEPPTRTAFFEHSAITVVKHGTQTEHAAHFEAVRDQREISITLGETTEVYRAQAVALYSQEKILLGSFIILHDLTQERELEKIKEETLNIVVHELRSPLNSVIGFSDLLMQPSGFDEQSKQQFITLIHQSGHKLLKLVNRFLDVMRLESGRQKIVRVPVYLPDIVRMLIDLLRPQAEEKSVSFAFKCDDDIPTIYASEELIAEAIQNLMTNAIKYGDPNRTIELELRATPKSVVFSITDYGYGIPPEAQAKLFTKFYRVQSDKHLKEIGTGLGLAYVKEIVSRHGGTISLESNAQIGSRFTITLPVEATKAAEPIEFAAEHK